MKVVSIGTNISSSITIPSSMSDVVGLKPSYGKVSKYGCFPEAWSLDRATYGEKVDFLDNATRLAGPVNLAELPSLKVPCGFKDEMPVCIQIIGPAFR